MLASDIWNSLMDLPYSYNSLTCHQMGENDVKQLPVILESKDDWKYMLILRVWHLKLWIIMNPAVLKAHTLKCPIRIIHYTPSQSWIDWIMEPLQPESTWKSAVHKHFTQPKGQLLNPSWVGIKLSIGLNSNWGIWEKSHRLFNLATNFRTSSREGRDCNAWVGRNATIAFKSGY